MTIRTAGVVVWAELGLLPCPPMPLFMPFIPPMPVLPMPPMPPFMPLPVWVAPCRLPPPTKFWVC